MQAILLLCFLSIIARGESTANSVNLSGDIMSLNFYPHKGIFLLSPHLTTTLNNQAKSSSTGVSSSIFDNEYVLALSYGLGTRLRLNISESVLWDESIDSGASPTGGNNVATSAGLSNPTFSVTWRFLENAASGLSGDVGTSIIPSVGHKVAADPTLFTIGNNVTGATTMLMSAALFWRGGFLELEIAGLATRQFGGRTEGSTTGNSSNGEGYSSYNLTFADRIHLSSQVYLNTSATVLLPYQHKLDYDNGVIRTNKMPTYWRPRIDLGFRPEPYTAIQFSVYGSKYTNTVTNSANSNMTSTATQSLIAEATMLVQFW